MSTSTEKTSRLDYCKIVLKKMSFNRRLFRKEYKKTFAYLDAVDHHTLKQWLRVSLLPFLEPLDDQAVRINS